MDATPTTQCPVCGGDVLQLVLEQNPLGFPIPVDATPDASGHVVETGNGTGRTLLIDRSDAGGADIYILHPITCPGA